MDNEYKKKLRENTREDYTSQPSESSSSDDHNSPNLNENVDCFEGNEVVYFGTDVGARLAVDHEEVTVTQALCWNVTDADQPEASTLPSRNVQLSAETSSSSSEIDIMPSPVMTEKSNVEPSNQEIQDEQMNSSLTEQDFGESSSLNVSNVVPAQISQSSKVLQSPEVSSSDDSFIAEAQGSDMKMQKNHETEREEIRARFQLKRREMHERFELEKREMHERFELERREMHERFELERREMHERFELEKEEIECKAKKKTEENKVEAKKSSKRKKNTKETTTKAKTSRKS